jgi:Fe2+ transport system protein FeoA
VSGHTLADLRIGECARIVAYDTEVLARGPLRSLPPEEVIRRIIELGITLNSKITVRHFGPVDRSPIAVEVRGAVIAIGRDEAAAVQVTMEAP